MKKPVDTMPHDRNGPIERLRGTKAQIKQRVEEILRIILDGARRWDIWQYIRDKVSEKDPVWLTRGEAIDLTERTMYRYVSMARLLIANSCRSETPKQLVARHIEQRRALYARAVSAADHRTALAILADEAKLLRLYPAERTEHTGPKGGPIQSEVRQVDVFTQIEAHADAFEVAAQAQTEEAAHDTIGYQDLKDAGFSPEQIESHLSQDGLGESVHPDHQAQAGDSDGAGEGRAPEPPAD